MECLENEMEKKTAVFSGKDLERMNTNEGCMLNFVDKPINLGDVEDDDEGTFSEDEYTSQVKGLDSSPNQTRMKREFLSIALNTNRDPMRSSSECRLKLLEDASESDGSLLHKRKLKTVDPDKIHGRYDNLGNYCDLLSNKELNFQEIIPDLVYKRQLYPGYGSKLIDGSSFVIYNCAFWTEQSSEPYDSTWLRHNTITSDLESDPILPGLYELLLTCKRGEFCEGLIKPEAAFGKLGVPPRVPPNATIFCLVEVVSVVKKDKVTRLASRENGATFEDFYQVADEARMRGNYYIERKEFNIALQRYKSGIRILESLTYKNEDEEKKAQFLLLKLHNNSAKAALELGNPRLALAACKQAQLINDMEPKTHWFKMRAWRVKGHLDRALGTCRRALQLFPDPKVQSVFRPEAENLKITIQKEQQELDKLHKLMGKTFA